MQYRRLGRSELSVSVVSMGTWAFGGKDFGPVYDNDSQKAIFRALDFGINFFDTAPLYGNGRAEDVLGKALKGLRDEVYIATKVGPTEPMPGVLSVNLEPGAIREQLTQSLKRLQTDYVDLLQIHWWDDSFSLEEALNALEDLKKEGLTREIGVSNFNMLLMQRVVKMTSSVVSLQPPCNLIDCPGRRSLFKFCEENQIGIIAYSALAKGLLTGKFRRMPKLHKDDIRLRDPEFQGERFKKNLSMNKELNLLASSIGLKITDLALAWVVAQKGVTTALFGAKTATQVAANARAGDIILGPDILREIEEIRSKYIGE